MFDRKKDDFTTNYLCQTVLCLPSRYVKNSDNHADDVFQPCMIKIRKQKLHNL